MQNLPKRQPVAQRSTMFIENVSYKAFQLGLYYDPGQNACAIQIVDPDMDFPDAGFGSFKKVLRLKFWDTNEESEGCFSDQQAQEVLSFLQDAYANESNVIVHCVAGKCRSGAIVEIGTIVGFADTGVHRIPNTLVKRKCMHLLDAYNFE